MSTNHMQIPTGTRFGKLVVIKFSHVKKGYGYHLCQCDCGHTCTVLTQSLNRGATQSCGCLHDARSKALNFKHGLFDKPGYWNWAYMKTRCKNHKHYLKYNITYCAGFEKIEDFFAVLGQKPFPIATLDRIDGTKGYFCGRCKECLEKQQVLNVRWASRKEQSNNLVYPNPNGNKGIQKNSAALMLKRLQEQFGIQK